jgi:hypothetical protein
MKIILCLLLFIHTIFACYSSKIENFKIRPQKTIDLGCKHHEMHYFNGSLLQESEIDKIPLLDPMLYKFYEYSYCTTITTNRDIDIQNEKNLFSYFFEMHK